MAQESRRLAQHALGSAGKLEVAMQPASSMESRITYLPMQDAHHAAQTKDTAHARESSKYCRAAADLPDHCQIPEGLAFRNQVAAPRQGPVLLGPQLGPPDL